MESLDFSFTTPKINCDNFINPLFTKNLSDFDLGSELGINKKTVDEEEEEEFQIIEEEVANDLWRMQTSDMKARKRRRSASNTSFWETPWGELISSKNVVNPKSREGKNFRRRFRLPYPLFQYLVQLCDDYNVFDSIYASKIPIQCKVLGCLRILARDACADDITEITNNNIGESTMNYVFKKFIHGIVEKIFPKFVKPAEGEYLKEVQASYEALGLPGAVGSMDVTHVKWTLCPRRKRFHAKGKEGYCSIAFQVIVDSNRRVQAVSQSFLGATNDKTICVNHTFSLAVQHGSLEDIEYELYDSFGEKYKCRGGYIIVDGGYVDSICFIDPDKNRINKQSVLWSEWLESVRKDVECFFGVLKIRFRFFRNGIGYHTREDIEAAFKTACTLHNMILLFDGLHTFRGWENVDWTELDPEGDDVDDEDFEENDLPEDESLPNLEESIEVSLQTPKRRLDKSGVTIFKATDPKLVLKQALQQSFTVQWIKNRLYWPKNMDGVRMSQCHDVTRI